MEIGYINVFVSDLNLALEFYRDLLGLELESADPDYGYASFRAGKIRLGLALPGEKLDLVGRHTGVGFVVSDVDYEYHRLRELGVEFSMIPGAQPWGGFMGLFQDPDGNIFYLDQADQDHS